MSRGVGDTPVAIASLARMSLAMFWGPIIATAIGQTKLPSAGFRKLIYYVPLFAFESAGGAFFIMYGMKHSSIAVGATLSSLAPVLIAPVAWSLGWEKFSPIKLFGLLMVMVGGWLLVF